MCYIQDIVLHVAAFYAEDLARCTVEAFGACGADQSLGRGDEAWEQEEPTEGGDLSVCEDGGFSEDGEAVCRGEMLVAVDESGEREDGSGGSCLLTSRRCRAGGY